MRRFGPRRVQIEEDSDSDEEKSKQACKPAGSAGFTKIAIEEAILGLFEMHVDR